MLILKLQPCVNLSVSRVTRTELLLPPALAVQRLEQGCHFLWWLSLAVGSAGLDSLDLVGWSTCLGLPALTDWGGSKAQCGIYPKWVPRWLDSISWPRVPGLEGMYWVCQTYVPNHGYLAGLFPKPAPASFRSIPLVNSQRSPLIWPIIGVAIWTRLRKGNTQFVWWSVLHLERTMVRPWSHLTWVFLAIIFQQLFECLVHVFYFSWALWPAGCM